MNRDFLFDFRNARKDIPNCLGMQGARCGLAQNSPNKKRKQVQPLAFVESNLGLFLFGEFQPRLS